MSVLDEYLVDPKVSLLDKTRIQAQVLVPVVRALRAELGKEAADALVRRSLRDWSKQLFAAIGDSVEGSSRRKWAAMHTAMAQNTERDVTVEMHRKDKEALEFDVTECRFAQFFRALGEPELGALLVCETDADIAAAGGNEVEFTRDQTIMQGAPSCTFRYKWFAERTRSSARRISGGCRSSLSCLQMILAFRHPYPPAGLVFPRNQTIESSGSQVRDVPVRRSCGRSRPARRNFANRYAVI